MDEKQWVKAKGRIVVDKKEGRIAVHLGHDFVNYYLWLAENELKRCFQIPRHSGHISLALKTHHKVIDFAAAKKFAGKPIEFEYCVDFEIGGGKKGFTCFWAKVRSKDIDAIKKELKIVESQGFLGSHVTLMSTKKMVERKFQKKMIEIQIK